LKDRQFEVSVAAESEPGEEDMTIVSRGEITATEMAIKADIDPKRFRQALRNEQLPWHVHNARWTVLRGSKEHSDMKRVLGRLLSH